MNTQLSLFSPRDASNESKRAEPVWYLYTDGACRGNPGVGGIGVLLLQGNKSMIEAGFMLPDCTNNQAEYCALLVGLWYAQEQVPAYAPLCIQVDSELLVQQMNGVYKIKDARLQHLAAEAKRALASFLNYRITHIPREQNQRADALANRGINTRTALPALFAQRLFAV